MGTIMARSVSSLLSKRHHHHIGKVCQKEKTLKITRRATLVIFRVDTGFRFVTLLQYSTALYHIEHAWGVPSFILRKLVPFANIKSSLICPIIPGTNLALPLVAKGNPHRLGWWRDYLVWTLFVHGSFMPARTEMGFLYTCTLANCLSRRGL